MHITLHQIGLLGLVLPVTGKCNALIYEEYCLLTSEYSATASVSPSLPSGTCEAYPSLICQLCA